MFPSPTAQALAATFHRTLPGQNLESPPMDEDRPCNIVENPWGFIALKQYKMNGTSRRLIEHVRITSDSFLPPTVPFNRAKGFDDGVMCGGSCAARTGRACLRLEAKDSTGSTMNHVAICLLVAPKLSAACASCGWGFGIFL